MIDKPVIIYALSDPRRPALIRYIGKTEQPLYRRLTSHIAERNSKDRSYKLNWIRKLLNEGLVPLIWPIEICRKDNWVEREQYWVKFFKPMGITNGTDGGEGASGRTGFRWSEEARKQMSVSRKGRKLPHHQIEQMRLRKLGTRHSQEVIEKIRTANLGKFVSQETKDKISRSKTGKSPNYSPEERRIRAERILRYRFTGPFIRTPEATEKCRLAQKGKLRPHIVMKGGKPIKCVETGEVFVSLWRAAQAKKTTCSHIRRSLKHGIATKGVHWQLI